MKDKKLTRRASCKQRVEWWIEEDLRELDQEND